jgi:hypothetical protein
MDIGQLIETKTELLNQEEEKEDDDKEEDKENKQK